MNLIKLKEHIDSTEVVEDLIIFSKKVFCISSEEAKAAVEMFITKSYLMGKKNLAGIIAD